MVVTSGHSGGERLASIEEWLRLEFWCWVLSVGCWVAILGGGLRVSIGTGRIRRRSFTYI